MSPFAPTDDALQAIVAHRTALLRSEKERRDSRLTQLNAENRPPGDGPGRAGDPVMVYGQPATAAQHAAAVTIQCTIRRVLAVRAVALLRERRRWGLAHAGAIALQRLYRGHAARVRVKTMIAQRPLNAIVRIQRRIRIHLARTRLSLMKADADRVCGMCRLLVCVRVYARHTARCS